MSLKESDANHIRWSNLSYFKVFEVKTKRKLGPRLFQIWCFHPLLCLPRWVAPSSPRPTSPPVSLRHGPETGAPVSAKRLQGRHGRDDRDEEGRGGPRQQRLPVRHPAHLRLRRTGVSGREPQLSGKFLHRFKLGLRLPERLGAEVPDPSWAVRRERTWVLPSILTDSFGRN